MIHDEDSARRWLVDHLGVSRETLEALDAFAALVAEEADRQNLISASTRAHVWQRHIADSAQLLRFVTPKADEAWLDLGSGAGFPGIVIALLAPCKVTLVESRALRIGFLRAAADRLGLARRVTIAGMPLERVPSDTFDYISARAFAPLPKLLAGAERFSTGKTWWLLPKGRNARAELESIAPAWQGVFHVEQSVTDADAAILVGKGRIERAAVKQRDPHGAPRRRRSER